MWDNRGVGSSDVRDFERTALDCWNQSRAVFFGGSSSMVTAHERFWAKVDKSGECWVWTGLLNDKGYGRFFRGQKSSASHRYAWESEVGPVPTGLQVGHLCHDLAAGRGECAGAAACIHRRCVRVDHLALQTPRENQLNSPLTIGSRNASKTQCPRGHALEGRRSTRRVHRECLVCHRARQLAHYQTSRSSLKTGLEASKAP